MNYCINKILSATWYPDICKDPNDYKVLAKLLHPDINHDPSATAAFAYLNHLKNNFEKGYVFSDESGEYCSNYSVHRWIGDKSMLKTSKSNYDKIILAAENEFDRKSFYHFMKYLPSNLEFEGNSLIYRSKHKCIPLSKAIQLIPEKTKEKHINWIFSRMIEFISMTEALGITHAGLNPDSVFIVPENHGIKVMTFYHTCTKQVKTICGKYKDYYPPRLFDTKEAGSYIDLRLIKKTAICGLGDASGSGTRLRFDSAVNPEVLNYMMTADSEAFRSMQQWREILNKNYIKEFVKLAI